MAKRVKVVRRFYPYEINSNETLLAIVLVCEPDETDEEAQEGQYGSNLWSPLDDFSDGISKTRARKIIAGLRDQATALESKIELEEDLEKFLNDNQ